jgi:hypothetical protein
MEFDVIKDADGHYDHYEGDDAFSIEAFGVLPVTLARSRRRVFYSPTGWLRLQAEPTAEPKARSQMLIT